MPRSRVATSSSIPSGARCVVRIDGKPYASFINRAYAEQAVRMWLGEIDGGGSPIPPQDRSGPTWPVLRGKQIEIVDR